MKIVTACKLSQDSEYENSNFHFVYIKTNFNTLFSSLHLPYMVTYIKKLHLEPFQTSGFDQIVFSSIKKLQFSQLLIFLRLRI